LKRQEGCKLHCTLPHYALLLQLVTEDQYDVIVNCAGLNGGKLAGDDNTCYPVRGVAIEVRAPWHKHFNYRDVDSFTIPMNDSVILGTLKQAHRSDMEITDEDRREIWEKYLKLHPTFKAIRRGEGKIRAFKMPSIVDHSAKFQHAKAVGEWIGLRPARPSVRLEKVTAKSASGKKCYIIHNYGHGSNGFTLSWGCAMNVLRLMEEAEDED
jgi:glycine/D-amino acid oxidase-like deaminating enzyme